MLTTIIGCASNNTVRNTKLFSSSYPSRSLNIGTDLSESIIFVADNQFHNIYSDPSLLGSRIADKIKSVAIRPSQLNLFSPDLFVYALRQKSNNSIIIHLGDALNISSTYEWNVFYGAISNKSIGHNCWFMIPGNHDVYFYGNGAGEYEKSNKRGGKKEWMDAANTTGVQISYYPKIEDIPFTKDLFVKHYVEHLLNQRIKGGSIIKESQAFYLSDKTLKECFEWESQNESSLINRIAGKYYDDDHYYWKSFIVQELLLKSKSNDKKISLILLDTTNYKKRPSFISWFRKLPWSKKVNAGTKGEISDEQKRIVDRWLKTNQCIRYLLVGHHPFNSLTKHTQKWMKRKTQSQNFITYISAHTHDPIKAYKSCNNELDISEFNVGSITDTPKTTPEKCKNISKPSPQYAILRTNGDIVIEDNFANLIAKKAISKGFPKRKTEYYMIYEKEAPLLHFWDSKKTPHRANLKFIAKSYIDMFNILYCGKTELIEILSKLHQIIDNEKIKKNEIIAYINTLKKAKKIDNDLRKINEDKRLLYGAWEAIQASLAEAGYCLIENNFEIIKCKK